MRRFSYLLFIFTVILGLQSCQEDDKVFGEVAAPANLQVDITVASDQSGIVSVSPSADNAINFHVFFEPDSETPPVVVSNGQDATFRYIQVGQYTRDIVVVAYGRGGASSSLQLTAELDVILTLDPETQFALAGTGAKTWVWDSASGGHFGVGSPDETFPNFFSAAPNQLDPCLYDDTLTFSFDGAGGFFYNLSPADATFINWTEIKRFFPDATPAEFVDECLDISDQIQLDSNFAVIENDGVTTLTVPNSTLSYYAGISEYEIVELTENKLVVRGIQSPFDPAGDDLAWYHTFIPAGTGAPSCAGFTGNEGSGNNDVLVWADEFEDPGTPCSANWTFEEGDGCPDLCGWGNDESQTYTSRSDNAVVEDGMLKITAKAESFEGSDYTSARMITKDKFEFQYGRVEMRAKLPTGAGTWPAFWMLGADIDTNPWPAAGEMDIMEHVGNQQDNIFNSLHFPGNSGGDAVSQDTSLPGASDNFNIYSLEWTEDQITFYINDVEGLSFPNSDSVPFRKDFFLILNVAMGGNFGGDIDPAFTESTFEIDYIRVYQ